MNKNLKIKNIIFISLSYFISCTLSAAFIYGLLFYNDSKLSGSTLEWSIIRSSFLLPGALVNIFSGIIADKYSKKKVMFLSEFANGIMIIAFYQIFLNIEHDLWFFVLMGFLSSFIYSFFEIALDASIISLAGEKLGEKLISIIWFLRAFAWIIGPPLGGYLYELNLLNHLFIFNAISFILSAFFILLLQFESSNEPQASNSSSFKKELRDLFNHIGRTPIIGFFLMLNLSFAFFYLPIYDVVIPNMANSLSFSNSHIAYIESAAWLGVALGAVIVSLSPSPMFYLRNLFTILKIESLFIFLWLFPIFYGGFSIERQFQIYVVLAIIDGALNSCQNLGAMTYFQLKVSKDLRGKILGTIKTVIRLSAPLGTLMVGFLLSHFLSWNIAILISATAMVIVVFYMERRRVFREFIESI